MFTLRLMNNKSRVGWHELVAHGDVKWREVSFFAVFLSKFEEINQFSHLDAVFFFVFPRNLSWHLLCFHGICLRCVHVCFWCEKQSTRWGVKKFEKFDFASRWVEWRHRRGKKWENWNHWPPTIVRLTWHDSMKSKANVVVIQLFIAAGLVIGKVVVGWRKLRWYSHCRFISYLFAYIWEVFPFFHLFAYSLLCVWYLRK